MMAKTPLQITLGDLFKAEKIMRPLHMHISGVKLSFCSESVIQFISFSDVWFIPEFFTPSV